MRLQRFPFALLGLLACGSGASSPDAEGDDENLTAAAPSADEAKACQKGSVGKNAAGDQVVHCALPFADAPFVRLPADKMSGAKATFYGGATVPTDFSGAFVIWGRDGKMYLPVDSSNAPIAYADGATKLPKGMHAPTNRMTVTIYQFAGKLGGEVDSPYGRATALQISAARPVVEIDGCAFDSRLLGTWEGTVSQRLETAVGGGPLTKNFDEATRVPIHVTLDAIAARPALSDYKGGKTLTDALTFGLSGTIDNFDRDVTVDGKTYPSLSDLGKKSPFYGAQDGKIELYRLGNMHGQQNDGHWVFTYPTGSQNLTGNGMSYTLTSFTAPSFLFAGGTSADPIERVEIRPHIPYATNGHLIELSPVAIGGKTGQCGQ